MGTLPEVPSHGLIYLQSSISSEFDQQLATTDHSADHFLEHLFELFSKSDKDARYLSVRSDLAQKFSALQEGSQFSCSSDLMRHLLQLHSRNSRVASSGSVKQVQDRQLQQQALAGGRKSRKSQPKRNLKHQVLIESQSDDGEKTPGDGVPQGWRERSVSSEEPEGATAEVGNASVPFDLSVVKQEVIEEEDTAREVTGKSGRPEQRPLCLSLHKPKFTHNTHIPQQATPDRKPEMITLQSGIRDIGTKHKQRQNAKKAKPLFQMNWRSSSEPPGQPMPTRPPPLIRHDSHEKNVSKPYVPPDSKPGMSAYSSDSKSGMSAYLSDSKPGNNMYPAEREQLEEEEMEDRNGYNYVLNSLASDNNDKYQPSSLPDSPMHVPVTYPKSIHYVLSSDEEEPQNLSYGFPPEEQPQNLTMSKPTKPGTSQAAVKVETIKYDSNANAVAVAPHVAQPDKPQFIAQAPFSVPTNLIFNDCRSVNNELMGQPQVFQIPVPQFPNSGSQEASLVHSQPGVIMSQPPRLQLINVIGAGSPTAAQFFLQPSIISSKSNFQTPPALVSASALVPSPILAPALTPSNAFNAGVTSPDDGFSTPNTVTGNDSTPNSEQGSPGSRKKRKRMEDTTTFRDPPEMSLPFNGPNKYRFYCDVCDTGFTRRYTFNRHKCKGRVEKHYCQMCDKAYLSKYKLKDHILVKHEGQTVACPDCGKKFSSRSSMEMHKKQQHEGQFSIWCKICGKGFNHTGHYYGHMNKHTNTKPFWCQQCGKRFFGSSYLHNHKQVCRGNSELNYPCTVCERRFKCELYLKKHMKTHDMTPIIADPSVANLSEAELGEVGVGLPGQEILDDDEQVNGELFAGSGAAVFPNGPENSDSNSGMLVIDENMNASDEGKRGKSVMLSTGEARQGETLDTTPADLSQADQFVKNRATPQGVTA